MTDTGRLTAALAGRYAIERELGAGGMATVYLARDLKHDRDVALKVLRPELAAVLGAERFLQEIRISARLDHPHFLTLIDSGESDGFVWYVLPYVRGESLRAKLTREKQLSIEEAKQIGAQVADALDYAHRHGVVHRDIKPENILLHDGGAMVADFGIALAVNRAGHERLTEPGLSLGTPEYMSPEQAAGDRELDGRSDIYSLGCVLYEMLAGEPPHIGGTVQSIIAKTLTDQPRRLRALRPSIPQAVDAAVHKALQKHPADRFVRAADFSDALNANTVHASPSTTAGDIARWQDRNRPVDRTFQLTMEICRKLNRATLPSRVIGDRLHYLDNEVESDLLVLYLHSLGLDQTSFDPILRALPYRGVAPTLYGFEPNVTQRVSLSLSDHITIVREFIRDAIRRLTPKVTLLVGFSHGADLGFEALTVPPGESPLAVDGFLSLGCNLDRGTCFVSSVLANLSANDTEKVVGDLRALGSDVDSLRDWLHLHEYLVRVFRKFQGELIPLRNLAREIVTPFESPEPPFPRWYQNAMTAVRCLRCVFADSEADYRAMQHVKLQHLDRGILGPRYREETIITEIGMNHFGLVELDLHQRHIEEMLASLRRAPSG